MSRVLQRVPPDFDWPLSERWKGYLYPGDPYVLPDCPDCDVPGYEQGLNPEGRVLWKAKWEHNLFSAEYKRIDNLLYSNPDLYWCGTCHGHGDIGTDEQRAELEAHHDTWYETVRYGPPAGDGWQLWETTSEGSPISPVFSNPEDLAEWMVHNDRWEYLNAHRWLLNEGVLVGIAMGFDADGQLAPTPKGA